MPRKIDLSEKIADSIVHEYLQNKGLVLTLSVFKPERNREIEFTRAELGGRPGGPSLLEAMIEREKEKPVPERTRSPAEKEPKIDYEKSMEDIDRQLLRVEREYIQKINQPKGHGRTLASITQEVNGRLEKEFEQKLRLFRERELREAVLKEREAGERRIRELERLYAGALKKKLNTLRLREEEIDRDREDKIKRMDSLRSGMERKILNDMHQLDQDRASFQQEKKQNFDLHKTLDIKLDERERNIRDMETLAELRTKNAEDIVQQKAQSVDNLRQHAINLQERNNHLLENAEEKLESAASKIKSQEASISVLERELKVRDFELSERASKYSELQSQKREFEDVIASQTALLNKKEILLGTLENRLQRVTEENIETKRALAEMKKAWIMKGQIGGGERGESGAKFGQAYKPII